MTLPALHANQIMRTASSLFVFTVLCAIVTRSQPILAQERTLHYFQDAGLPPGELGRSQLQRFSALRGYFQPVECSVPAGATLALAVDGTFATPVPTGLRVGLLIGPVYRLKISNVRFYEDREVFPTIEVIQRLYPPEGQAERFPIPIQFIQEELELALAGNYITRVIYLEDSGKALPYQQAKGQQHVYQVRPHEDPLRIADDLGRPMAIIRMGSRLPLTSAPDDQFMFGRPPILKLRPRSTESKNLTSVSPKLEETIVRENQNFPRVPTRQYPVRAPTVLQETNDTRVYPSRGRINR